MPVFNGELYIHRAIESILAQTYDDFCLLILDNASIDRTADIAKRYASLDSRVHYQCNECNIGAAPNFNRVFDLSNTTYFKWAAHDDELAPTYLDKCVQALDGDSTAVLAHSYVQEIDHIGNRIQIYRPVPEEIESRHRLVRFKARLMHRGPCTELCGLLRSKELLGTGMIGSFAGSDLSLIIELSLRGRFIIVPEPLFLHRTHAASYTSTIFDPSQDGVGRERIVSWLDTSKKTGWRQMHWWIFFGAHFRIINRNVRSWLERARYYGIAMRWLTAKRNIFDLAKDSLFGINPMLLQRAMRLKRQIAGSRRRSRGGSSKRPERGAGRSGRLDGAQSSGGRVDAERGAQCQAGARGRRCARAPRARVDLGARALSPAVPISQTLRLKAHWLRTILKARRPV